MAAMTVEHGMPVYPGQGELPDPTKVLRVKAEGEDNYIKNKGTIKERVFDDTAPIIKTPKPNLRCPTSDSKQNYKAGWFGTVPPLLNGTSSPRPNTAPPRVKPEAESTAHISRGPRMKVIVHDYARSGPSPRHPRVKSEGQEIAEVSKGARMSNIIHKYGTLPLSARRVPRLQLNTEPMAENSRGKQMCETLHKYGQSRGLPGPHPRVKVEGESNAELDKGKRMAIIFRRYGQCPLTSRPVPRVKYEGETNASLDTGFRMSRLLHEPWSTPVTPRPIPRTNSSQARNNSFKGRGTMDKIFKTIEQKTFIYNPGQQSRQYTRASIS